MYIALIIGLDDLPKTGAWRQIPHKRLNGDVNAFLTTLGWLGKISNHTIEDVRIGLNANAEGLRIEPEIIALKAYQKILKEFRDKKVTEEYVQDRLEKIAETIYMSPEEVIEKAIELEDSKSETSQIN